MGQANEVSQSSTSMNNIIGHVTFEVRFILNRIAWTYIHTDCFSSIRKFCHPDRLLWLEVPNSLQVRRQLHFCRFDLNYLHASRTQALPHGSCHATSVIVDTDAVWHLVDKKKTQACKAYRCLIFGFTLDSVDQRFLSLATQPSNSWVLPGHCKGP